MSRPGTTWFKSKRKLTALIAGAAIVAGAAGAAAPNTETEVAGGSHNGSTTVVVDLGGELGSSGLFSTWS